MVYNKNKLTRNGFTLLELLITLSILSILSFSSIYYYQSHTNKTKLGLYLNQFYVDLSYAKEQALNKHAAVHICPVNHDWKNGYQVMLKAEQPSPISTHSLLTRTPLYPSSFRIQAHFGLNQPCVYFNTQGKSLFNGHIIYSLEETSAYGKIILTQTGKMHLELN